MWKRLYFLRHKSVAIERVLRGFFDVIWTDIESFPADKDQTWRSCTSTMSSVFNDAKSASSYSMSIFLGAPSIIIPMIFLIIGRVVVITITENR